MTTFTFVSFDVLMTDQLHIKEPLMDRKGRLFDAVQSSDVLTSTMFVDGAGRHLKRLAEDRNWRALSLSGRIRATCAVSIHRIGSR